MWKTVNSWERSGILVFHPGELAQLFAFVTWHAILWGGHFSSGKYSAGGLPKFVQSWRTSKFVGAKEGCITVLLMDVLKHINNSLCLCLEELLTWCPVVTMAFEALPRKKTLSSYPLCCPNLEVFAQKTHQTVLSHFDLNFLTKKCINLPDR